MAQTVASHSDLEGLIAGELRRAIAVDGRSIEAVGQAAGFSRGYLSQLLRGRQDLKIQHVVRVLAALELDAIQFLRRVLDALWETSRAPAAESRERRLPKGASELPSLAGAAQEGQAWTHRLVNEEEGRRRLELHETIREIVREELPRQLRVEIGKKNMGALRPAYASSIGVHEAALVRTGRGDPAHSRDPLERLQWRLALGEQQFSADVKEARRHVQEIVQLEPGERQARIHEVNSGFRGPLFGTLLLEEARRAIPADPAESLSLAEAALVSCQVTHPSDPDPLVRAPALAVRGNARRALGRLLDAEADLEEAQRLLDSPGVTDPATAAELSSYLGSLRKDQGRFDEAAHHLHRAAALYGLLRDRERAARVLLKLGTLHYRRHELAAAVEADEEALGLLDAGSEAWLRAYARYNLAFHLHTGGETERAEAELAAHAELLASGGEHLAMLIVWLRARIAWSRGELRAAERLYTEARRRALERGIAFDAGLIALELALVHLVQSRAARVKKLAVEALRVFAEQDVQRETRAALELLEAAARREALTRELVERAITALEGARHAHAAPGGEPA